MSALARKELPRAVERAGPELPAACLQVAAAACSHVAATACSLSQPPTPLPAASQHTPLLPAVASAPVSPPWSSASLTPSTLSLGHHRPVLPSSGRRVVVTGATDQPLFAVGSGLSVVQLPPLAHPAKPPPCCHRKPPIGASPRPPRHAPLPHHAGPDHAVSRQVCPSPRCTSLVTSRARHELSSSMRLGRTGRQVSSHLNP